MSPLIRQRTIPISQRIPSCCPLYIHTLFPVLIHCIYHPCKFLSFPKIHKWNNIICIILGPNSLTSKIKSQSCCHIFKIYSFLLLNSIALYRCTTVEGHLGYFQFMAFMNKKIYLHACFFVNTSYNFSRINT